MPEHYKYNERMYSKPWGYKRAVIHHPQDKSIEFVEINMEPGQGTKPHYHETVTEHFYILEGTAVFTVDGREYNASKGDFMVIKPGEKHMITAGRTGVKILAVKKPGYEEDRIFL